MSYALWKTASSHQGQEQAAHLLTGSRNVAYKDDKDFFLQAGDGPGGGDRFGGG